jgi:hypothetical protein
VFLNVDDITLHGTTTVGMARPVLQVRSNIYVYGASAIFGVDGQNRLDLRALGGSTEITAPYTNIDASAGC